MGKMLHSTWYRSRRRAQERKSRWLRRWGQAVYRTFSFKHCGAPDSPGLQRLAHDLRCIGLEPGFDRDRWLVWPASE